MSPVCEKMRGGSTSIIGGVSQGPIVLASAACVNTYVSRQILSRTLRASARAGLGMVSPGRGTGRPGSIIISAGEDAVTPSLHSISFPSTRRQECRKLT